jgi:NADPH:quinone reductase-like Zn-dependent oxidoreductase
VEKGVKEGENSSVQLVEEFDAILELVGYSTIIDSLKIVDRGGRVGLAGFLGGLASIPDSNTVLQMASGVYFSFFGSFAFGSPEFPLSMCLFKKLSRWLQVENWMLSRGEFSGLRI